MEEENQENNHVDINEVEEAVRERSILKLRELAGRYSDNAAIDQDPTEIKLAMMTYSLNKIYGKIHLRAKTKELDKNVMQKLKEKDYDTVLEEIFRFDREHGLFHDGLENKAKIKIGSRLYSQGISLAQSASLVKVASNEIQDYVGDTKEHDTHRGKTLEERLRKAREILG